MPPCLPTGGASVEDGFDAGCSSGRLDWSFTGRETKRPGRPQAVQRRESDLAAASHRRPPLPRRASASDVLERARREVARRGSEAVPPPPPPSDALPPLSDCGRAFRSPSFYCPLTMAVMTDPVQDREGNSYEKDAIERWLTSHETSPITRNRLRKRHLVPNRALKEAIDHERQRAETDSSVATARKPREQTDGRAKAVAVPARAAAPTHQQTINDFLANLKVKSSLDRFGIALLPMKKLQRTTNSGDPIDMVMVIEAPPAKDTFRLYTHFAGRNAARDNAGSNSENDKVFDNLLKHGRHKSLTLQRVCAERVRFGFEGRGSEVGGCQAKLRAMLDMFVKVAVRMRKRIES
ncbi:hypothetical protein ACHAXT_010605 [Thalassiosira profunda]